MVSWARSSCELAESSKRFYTEKRKPVGPEVQGHKGEGWGIKPGGLHETGDSVPSVQRRMTFPEAEKMMEARGHVLHNHYSLSKT